MKTEITNKRTKNAKVFDLGGSQRGIEVSLSDSVHIPSDFAAWRRGEDVEWLDKDLGYDDDTQTGEYVLRNHWFRLKVAQGKVAFRYQSRFDGRTVEMELMRLDGKKVPVNIDAPTLVDGNWQWSDVVNGFDVYITVSDTGVNVWKRMKNDLAPKQYTWKVTESAPPVTPLAYISTGYDNADRSDASRLGTGPGRVRRKVEMLDPVITDRGAGVTEIVEEWTGRVITRTANRVFVPTNDVSYPVLIDPSIPEEGIANNADDGFSINDGTPTWEVKYSTSNWGMIYAAKAGEMEPGFRFRVIPDIASGDTIDSATLTVVYGTSGGNGSEESATVRGVDADDAPLWSDSFNPATGVTTTTASTAFPAWGNGQSGTKNINVQTIVQEIVNRAGWEAGNDIGFVVQFSGASENYSYLGDASGSGTPATLNITYTATGGGGPILPIFRHHYARMQR